MRPLGFEPRTCGLRVGSGGVHRVACSALTCGYVLFDVQTVPLDPPSDAEIVGWIVGGQRRRDQRVGTIETMTTSLRLDPELAAVVERARQRAAAAGELTPARGLPIAAIRPAVGEMILDLIRDGTYAKAIANVVDEDPELADL